MRLLLLAVILGGIFRLIALQNYPIGFTPDEAAFGYNAYSLLETGLDEWGTPFWQLPFTNLRSFGDYKLPLYSFLAAPSIAIFGLTEFATRLPNALFGTLAIPAIYLLAKKLFNHSLEIGSWKLDIALVAAILFALSPWSIQLSRGAFEANLITFLLPITLVLFSSKKFILGFIFLALNFYSYHSARYISILIGLVLPFIAPKKYLLLGLIFLPGLLSLLSVGGSRTADVSILSPTDNWAAVSDRRFEAVGSGLSDSVARLFSNKPISIFREAVARFLAYFSPQFLFSEGPRETTFGMQPGRGVLYFIELPLLLAFGICFARRPTKKLGLLILILLVSALPATLAKGPGGAANRAATMLPFLTLASSVGLIYLLRTFSKYSKIILTVFLVLLFTQFTFFLETYIFHSPKALASGMLYGYKEAFNRAEPMFANFDQIAVSRSLSEPHIYVAFYTQFDPREYQIASRDWSKFSALGYKFLDQFDGYKLAKFTFGDLHLNTLSPSDTLLIGKSNDFPLDYPKYFAIDYPNGETAVIVAKK